MLQENALRIEADRRLPSDIIDALTTAGMPQLRAPARHGGHEVDIRTMVDVIAELARGDASTAWTVSVWCTFAWIVGFFPEEVQAEVFGSPGARVSGVLGKPGTAVPTDGGYLISGRWAFNTGATQSDWNVVIARHPLPEGKHRSFLMLAKSSDFTTIDDWHSSGLCGSGSVTSVAKDVFIPEARALPMPTVLKGQSGAQCDPDNPFYRTPLFLGVIVSVAGVPLGLARAAREAFHDRLPGRAITYTDYASQSAAPITHMQVGTAAMLLDEAEFHITSTADFLDEKSVSNPVWTLSERARVRFGISASCLRAKEAVDILTIASGASSVYRNVPIQRIDRDIRVVHQHASLHPNTAIELHGRMLCGLEPNTNNL
ncbi:acyl-CoA dehydrogenase family protein [Nocardia altamirensis]|uniref:acyl-CoA dehydrogenase family protein n=1 Tax=Nocardia altamirensis TaxID=472158 RepID=UPI001C3FCD61|nr:acyl-CoA dehydrogenase family protein [Nocardia altamirensis]